MTDPERADGSDMESVEDNDEQTLGLMNRRDVIAALNKFPIGNFVEVFILFYFFFSHPTYFLNSS